MSTWIKRGTEEQWIPLVAGSHAGTKNVEKDTQRPDVMLPHTSERACPKPYLKQASLCWNDILLD